MAMTNYFYEHELQEHFRQRVARDLQLTRWGWFRRHEHRPRKSTWQFRAGEALIRLGCWMKKGRGAHLAGTLGEP